VVIKFINTQPLICKYLSNITKVKSYTYNNPLNILLNSLKNVNYTTQLLTTNLYINFQLSYVYNYLLKSLRVKSFLKGSKFKVNLINTHVTNLI
jgi:hypothetical protein